jgi:hypothetical protein
MADSEEGEEPIETWLEENTEEMTTEEKVDMLMSEVRRLNKKIRDLEAQQDQHGQDLRGTQDMVRQLNRGEISGEAGAKMLLDMAPDPDGSLSDARVRQVYSRIVEQNLVGSWVKTGRVKRWLEVDHNTQVHRVMEDVEEQVEQGVLLGHVEREKHHGQWCLRLTGSKQEGEDG